MWKMPLPNDLELVLIVSGSALALGVAAALAIGTARWRQARKRNPAHLVVVACTAMAVAYWSMYFAFGHTTRDHDGRVVWWIRSAAHCVVALANGWILGSTLHLNEEAGWFALLVGHLVAAAAFLCAELSTHKLNLWWWGCGMGVSALAMLLTVRSARRQDVRARLLLAGAAIVFVGVPIIQLLGYSMLEVLDTAPQRLNTEIAYSVAYGAGVLIWGLLSIVFYRERPLASQAASLREANTSGARTGMAPFPVVKASTPATRSATMRQR